MPRAAVLSIHARVEGTTPDVWEDPALVQLWGPRFSAYVVAADDRAVFTRGRLPEAGARLQRAEDMADRLQAFIGTRRMAYGDVGRAMGVNHNALRYAAPTGTVLLRWDGARQPVIWTVPAPEMEPRAARLELARRYLHVFGPSTAEEYAKWAGIMPRAGVAVFAALGDSLIAVRTPIGQAWILSADEATVREPAGQAAPARLLPSGDAYFLLWGAQRELLVPDPAHRDELWTSRVWPGALLVNGQIIGTWRRAQHIVSIQAWQRVSRPARDAIASEAASLPLPGLERDVVVQWDG
jgi:hypothetical protein